MCLSVRSSLCSSCPFAGRLLARSSEYGSKADDAIALLDEVDEEIGKKDG